MLNPQFSNEDQNSIRNASDRVVVVAARIALDEYLKYSAYICQPDRAFRDCLYVCTFEKGSGRKGHHVVSRRRISTLETMEVSDASSHYMYGLTCTPLCRAVSEAVLQAPIPVLGDRTAGADAL